MADIARILRFDDQPPLIRVVLSFCIVVIAGTIFSWILILVGSFIFGLKPDNLVQLPSENQDGQINYILKYVQFCQQMGLFLLPSLIVAWLMGEGAGSYLRAGRLPKLFPLVLVVIVAIAVIPLINYTGYLNSKLTLPDSISGIRDWIRTSEDNASHKTSILIASPDFLTFGINIFILAILPSVCEEFLFRGVAQRLMSELCRSSHAGIWVTAIIFSSIHMQFFGFIPRMILGLLFGYLFWWSGNLWYPVAAHFMNNAIPVTASYLNAGKTPIEPATQAGGNLLFLPVAAIIVSFLLYCFWSVFRNRSASSGDRCSDDRSTG